MERLLTISLMALGLSGSLAAQGTDHDHVPGDILAMLAPGAQPEAVAAELADAFGQGTDLHVAQLISDPMRAWLFHFDPAQGNEGLMLRAFRQHPQVQLAQYNHIVQYRAVPNDTQYGQQWQHQNIDSELAWDITTGGLTATGDTIVVCVLENSDLPHPDLIDNAWFNHLEVPNNGIDDDANGYVDDYEGWNTQALNDNVYGGSHGTQVCGMIGAVGDNGQGVAGANWNVKIMVVEFGGVQEAQVVAAYTYPWAMRKLWRETNGSKGAFVVSTNASWGIDGGQPANAPLWCAIYDSLGTEGILNCGATANQSYDVDQVGDLPTACPSDFMVSVTATNSADNRTFSAWGATTIDVGAPGDNVYTTSLGGGYGSTSGTSFASPFTAGVIGLLYSAPCTSLMDQVFADPSGAALYVRQALFDGVEQVGNLPGDLVTGGRINVNNSLQLIMNDCGSCPTPYGATVEAMGADAAMFSWNSTGTGPYNVQYRPVGTSTWESFPNVINMGVQVNGLMPCTAYEFQVEALCDTITSGFGPSVLLEPPVEPVPTITLDNEEVFCEGDQVTLTSSAATNLWSTGETTASIVVDQTGTYTVDGLGVCDTASSAAVDILVLDFVLPTANDVNLPGPGTATLTATGDSILWYDVQLGGSPVGSGTSWDTPFLSTTTDFWCTNTEVFGGAVSYAGEPDNSTQGQYHGNGNNWILFTATEAFTIRSVKVYASGAGNRPISLIDMDNSLNVAAGTFNLPDGESRVQLDFEVPGPGNYGLRITSGNPQLWRDGLGSNPGYPFPIGTFGTITGTTVTGANSTAYYYFFYDWEVEAFGVGCESDRVQVTVSMPTGLEEHAGPSVNVFPDPADRDVFFDLSGYTGIGQVQVTIFDASGRAMATKPMLNGRATVTTAWLADGLYSYLLTSNGQPITSGRFVVSHL